MIKALLRFRSLVLALTCFGLVSTAAAEDAPNQRDYLVFGFLPIVSSERLVRRFSPLVDYLSRELALDIRMESAPDFSTFVYRTQHEKRYDILFTAPHLYYLAHHSAGYRSLARVDQEGMNALIVVPAGSDIGTLQDLRGRRLATTGQLALATVLASEHLLRSGLDPDADLTLVYTPSHNASLLLAHQGTTDASALMSPVYRRMPREIVDDMKIIAETRRVPHIPISAAPWLDAALVSRLRQALLNLQNSAGGPALLKQLGWPGFTATRGGEYNSLESIARQMQVQ